jgi:tRNA threonylcarbamoyladenosine biosynthesis protein TsaE
VKEFQFQIQDLSELSAVAEQILQSVSGCKVFTFYAEMGAGKTTLIKEFCSQLGCKDNFSSPTYSIVNEYKIAETNQPVYHMDLYRLKSTDELLSAGVGEYINGVDYCFIEWPNLAEPFLPEDTVRIHISVNDNVRNLTIFMG